MGNGELRFGFAGLESTVSTYEDCRRNMDRVR
jgi:hypothetical protein